MEQKSVSLTFNRHWMEDLRMRYRSNERRSREFLRKTKERPDLDVAEKRAFERMYEDQEIKARGMAEAVEEILFAADGEFPRVERPEEEGGR